MGAKGEKGDTGDTGPKGDKGDKGDPGADAEGPYVFLRAPDNFDDINSDFSIGSIWVDTLQGDAYILIDNAPGAAVWKLITDQPSTIFAIGDRGPAGGIVFYVRDGGLHGLEAAPVINEGVGQWGCSGVNLADAEGTVIGTGAQNTADILAGCSTAGIAARIADAYTLNGFSDWFLPSQDELIELYLNRASLDGFSLSRYWSSSEFGSIPDIGAFGLDFSDGSQLGLIKSASFRVRPVRAF